MYLIWGRLPLRVSRLIAFDAEVVLDPSGVDYLWTDYTVAVECLWGRQTDGYSVAQMTPEGPIPKWLGPILAGVANGVQSVADTRHALSQRSPFVLFSHHPVTGQAVEWLSSDVPDAQNGPLPVEPPSVIGVHGDGSLVFVRFTFKVSVCDCPIAFARVAPNFREVREGGPNVKNPVARKRFALPPVDPLGGIDAVGAAASAAAASAAAVAKRRLDAAADVPALAVMGPRLSLLRIGGNAPVLRSNRWTSSIAYDPTNENPVYNIRGQAIFRRDALHALGVTSIDQFRGSLLPLVADNAVREINDVSISPDGLTLSYDVTDRVVTRGYLDFRCRLTDGKIRLVQPGLAPRLIANVALTSRRTYSQPNVGSSVFDFFDHLSTVNFAIEKEDSSGDAAGKLPVAGQIADVAKQLNAKTRDLLNKLIAGARTVNSSLLPTVSEFAASSVQITREGRLADAQALAMSLVAGALGHGNGSEPWGRRALNIGKYAALPPANTFTIECDHVNGRVSCAADYSYSGLVDFCLLGRQQAAVTKLLQPIPDNVIGGRPTIGIFNVLDALGLLPDLANKLIGGFGSGVEAIAKLTDSTVANRYADDLLLTDADVKLRGPAADGYSRGLADTLMRSAAMLLAPCEQHSPPANLTVDVPHLERAVESDGGDTKPQPASPAPDTKSILDAFKDAWSRNVRPTPKGGG